jgi:hypothetical protein
VQEFAANSDTLDVGAEERENVIGILRPTHFRKCCREIRLRVPAEIFSRQDSRDGRSEVRTKLLSRCIRQLTIHFIALSPVAEDSQ